VKQTDLFGADDVRERLATEKRAADREEPAYRAGMTQRGASKTSVAAAKKINRMSGTIREAVEMFARQRGATGYTNDELMKHFGCGLPNSCSESGHRRRNNELGQDGIILDSGTTRSNRRGNKESVWVHKDSAQPTAKPIPPKVAREDGETLRKALRAAKKHIEERRLDHDTATDDVLEIIDAALNGGPNAS
jgi:hypothetical protein